MTQERCELCRFWPVGWTSGFGQVRGTGGPHCDGSVSDCRRHAPTIVEPGNDPHIFGNARWPTTKSNDWCGEFEARPTDGGESP